ncbi:MAG: single-stranded-DNA-specific exonuclease RecJ [Eubacteriales bacterium]|nr:single-stranded-DNA-specific exonuclease RecJ [Eubacteriales bacterium]
MKFVKREAAVCAEGQLTEYSEIMRELLLERGVTTDSEAREFLSPSPSGLHDSFQMADMNKAVDLLMAARDNEFTVAVFGDYDSDGVMASALLLSALRAEGFNAFARLPSRQTEGYGLNAEAVRELSEKAQMLITVDCGITNYDEVALAKELGMLVIVTDHHELAPVLPPADAVINPKREGYPCKNLCGAGVALKLVEAFAGREKALSYIGFAGFATIADMVELLGENRVIASLGIEAIKKTENIGLKMLIDAAGVKPEELTAEKIAFQLSPRINAGGRMDDASIALDMLMTDNADEALWYAKKLSELNEKRKSAEKTVLEEAENDALSRALFSRDKYLVAIGEQWQSGVIGLAAGRLMQKYHLPALVLARVGDSYVGSGRSVKGVDLHSALSRISDLFLRFGGHAAAAGLTVHESKLDEFLNRLPYAFEDASPEILAPQKEYDLSLTPEAFTEALISDFDRIEPCGLGNPKPAVLLPSVRMDLIRAIGASGAHLRCELSSGVHSVRALAFGMGRRPLFEPFMQDVLCTPKINVWKDVRSVEAQASAICPSARIEDFDGAGLSDYLKCALKKEIGRFGAIPDRNKDEDSEFITYYPSFHDFDKLCDEITETGRAAAFLCYTSAAAKYAYIKTGMKLPVFLGCVGEQLESSVLLGVSVSALPVVLEKIVFMDGCAGDFEIPAVRERCPKAKIYVMPKSKALCAALAALSEVNDSDGR